MKLLIRWVIASLALFVAAWLVPATGSLTLLVAALVGHGTGFALFSSPNMAVIMRSTPKERTGMASALAAQRAKETKRCSTSGVRSRAL